MNILLVGELSRLHNSLKEGLEKLGHTVVIMGFGDGFKNYPVDLPLIQKWNDGPLKKFKLLLYKTTGFNITSWLTYRQFKKHSTKLKQYDVVQLVNENAFYCSYYYEKKMLRFLFKHNPNVYLMCCGTDFLTVKYYFDHRDFQSVLQPYFEGKISKKEVGNILKFQSPAFQKLHKFIHNRIRGIIASDLDYHIPMKGEPKYLGMIPNPINCDLIPYMPIEIQDRIVIFHGINKANYLKKGNDYFDKAIQHIREKYGERVEIIRSENVPYEEYIKSYNKAHILLDMVYGYDQGFHALEAMAKGKVVFTCAEQEFYDHYQLTEKVNINAKPNVDYLVEQLSHLIDNPDELTAIGERARQFVEEKHHYVRIADAYCKMWQQSMKSV